MDMFLNINLYSWLSKIIKKVELSNKDRSFIVRTCSDARY